MSSILEIEFYRICVSICPWSKNIIINLNFKARKTGKMYFFANPLHIIMSSQIWLFSESPLCSFEKICDFSWKYCQRYGLHCISSILYTHHFDCHFVIVQSYAYCSNFCNWYACHISTIKTKFQIQSMEMAYSINTLFLYHTKKITKIIYAWK